MLLEDAIDLANWRTLPTVTEGDGRIIHHGAIPHPSEWVEAAIDEQTANDMNNKMMDFAFGV